MIEQGILLTCCMALPVLILVGGMKLHRYNRRITVPNPQHTKR